MSSRQEQSRISRPKSLEAALNKFDEIQEKLQPGANAGSVYERQEGRSMTIDQGLPPRVAEKRQDRRCQTMPDAMGHRRGDTEVSEELMSIIHDRQEELKKRIRRGSLFFGTITDEHYEAFWDHRCVVHVHGSLDNSDVPFKEREVFHVGSIPLSEVHDTMGVSFSCIKGFKGEGDNSLNQDNFSITRLDNGWDIICVNREVMDGHGPNGHMASYRAVRSLPYYLAHSDILEPSLMEKCMEQCFQLTNQDMLGHALANDYEVQASGTTAVVFIRNHKKDPDVFWSAHCGDSRLVVGTEAKRTMEFVTADHKPDSPSEQPRIEASGGEVRSFTYDDNWTVHRIFVRDADYPGLCMARSLGDLCVKTHGVTCDPEVHRHTLPDRKSKPLIIMASDGVWEFLSSEWVMKALSRKVGTEGASRCIQKLSKEARKRWKEEEGDYCDDITSVIIQFK
ncbi:hypothetical protein FOZ61_004178 [Perkinsus olseni]|uniref:PPM-type phosphatase domain-containing protein n=1 Tax=Perkinsus olseni TaxID=32597 RepID=A0A7J6MCX7_PEROL|nr:hypothetical protein FOZ61_004178 [Perkinsus olseni]KAF4674897.1 hypothetical protein FOL46_003638 [Perkinsus olseni]